MDFYKISVFWDRERCPPQTEEDVSLVLDRICLGLENFQIQGKISVFVFGLKNQISHEIITRMRRLGIKMNLFESNHDKGLLYFMNEIMSLKYNVAEGVKIACVLVSGDERFGSLFHNLKWLGGYNTFLVHPCDDPRALPDSCLVCAFEKVWSYTGLVNGVGPN